MKQNQQLKMLFIDDAAQEPTRFALIEDVLQQCQGDLFENQEDETCADCECLNSGHYPSDCPVDEIAV